MEIIGGGDDNNVKRVYISNVATTALLNAVHSICVAKTTSSHVTTTMETDTSSKQISYAEPYCRKQSSQKQQQQQQKQRRRIETTKWNIPEHALTTEYQLNLLAHMVSSSTHSSNDSLYAENNNYIYKSIITHIKQKLHSYCYQDELRRKKQVQLLEAKCGCEHNTIATEATATTTEATTSTKLHWGQVLHLLWQTQMQCHYCKNGVLILYPDVRQTTQWTLDRIDNTRDHSLDNVVLACLQCNIKRQIIRKELFYYTKTLQIHKHTEQMDETLGEEDIHSDVI